MRNRLAISDALRKAGEAQVAAGNQLQIVANLIAREPAGGPDSGGGGPDSVGGGPSVQSGGGGPD